MKRVPLLSFHLIVDEEQRELAKCLVARFKECSPACKETLVDLLVAFPGTIYLATITLETDADGQLQLHYKRDELQQRLRECKSRIILTSWERALKHCGMKVLQTTHGTQPWKKWGMPVAKPKPKPFVVPAPPRKKRKADGNTDVNEIVFCFPEDPEELRELEQFTSHFMSLE